ncbi:MAG: integrase [Mycobacterium sp.]|nr:integrase [Mycobacterium sp.]
MQPACRALKLGNVRFHLWHTFATMNLSAGEHYIQVSKWLGQSTFVFILPTHADYINEEKTGGAEDNWTRRGRRNYHGQCHLAARIASEYRL